MSDNIEKNKHEATFVAEQILQILRRDLVEEIDPQVKFDFLMNKFPSFSRAYQCVLHKMIFENRYNKKAFEKLIHKTYVNPGKGMEGFIERQADYVKYLYVEECKAKGQRPNMNVAKKMWEQEHAVMWTEYKKIMKSHEEAKNEFSKEEEKHKKEYKDELLNFYRIEREKGDVEVDNCDLMHLDEDVEDLIKIITKEIPEQTTEYPEMPPKQDKKNKPIRDPKEIENSFIDETTRAFFERKNAKKRGNYIPKRRKNKSKRR